MIASLPMYDWPEVRPATDALWRAVAGRLAAAESVAPDALDRSRRSDAVWLDPKLLLSQTCGYPFATRLSGKVRLVATPCYAADGCRGPLYSSALVAHVEEGGFELAGLAGCRVAFNSTDSLSGSVAVRAAMRQAGVDPAGFQWIETGSHRASLLAVAKGAADLAGIDAICWAYGRRFEPEAASRLKAIGWTALRPGLPFITALGRTDDEIATIRQALFEFAADPETAPLRRELGLTGFSVLSEADYAPIAALQS